MKINHTSKDSSPKDTEKENPVLSQSESQAESERLESLKKRREELKSSIKNNESELSKRRDELVVLIKQREAEIKKKADEIERLEKRNEREKKQKETKKRVDEVKEKLKRFLRKNIAMLSFGAIAFSAVTAASTYSKSGKLYQKEGETEKFFETKSEEQKNFEALTNQVIEKVDTNLLRDLSDSAQERYVSMIVKDIKDAETAKARHDGVVIDSFDNEYDPKEIQQVDLFGVIASSHESGGGNGGDYSTPCSASNACGKYQVMPSAWFHTINLNPNDTNDIKKYFANPSLQEEVWNNIYKYLHDKYGATANFPQKFLAGILLTGTGPDMWGTSAGDDPVDAFGTTINGYVSARMPAYNKLYNATKDGGRWLADKERQKLYWVGLDYKDKWDQDIRKIVPQDKNEAYVAPVGQKNLEDTKKIAEILRKKFRTADFAEEFNKNNEKLPTFKDAHPYDPKIISKRSYYRPSFTKHDGFGKQDYSIKGNDELSTDNYDSKYYGDGM